MTNGSLTKDESIAECSPWRILQYFWPALSDNWSWKPICGLFESGCFTQVLQYALNLLRCFSLMFLQAKCLLADDLFEIKIHINSSRAHSTICSESDCWSRGGEFDPGPHTLVVIYQEIFFYGHSSPSTDSRRAVVSYKRKYVQWVLVNRLV